MSNNRSGYLGVKREPALHRARAKRRTGAAPRLLRHGRRGGGGARAPVGPPEEEGEEEQPQEEEEEAAEVVSEADGLRLHLAANTTGTWA